MIGEILVIDSPTETVVGKVIWEGAYKILLISSVLSTVYRVLVSDIIYQDIDMGYLEVSHIYSLGG